MIVLTIAVLPQFANAQNSDRMVNKSAMTNKTVIEVQNSQVDSSHGYSSIGSKIDDKRNGYWTYFKNSILEQELFLTNSIIDGPQIKYYANGNIQSYCSYKMGAITGAKVDFYEGGELRMLENYKDGKLNFYKTFSKEGVILGECIYPSADSINYICGEIGDEYTLWGPMSINDSVYFTGNQWYYNGSIAVECFKETSDNSVVSFKYFDRLGHLLSYGKFKYVCNYGLCDWRKTGTWNWYDSEESIIKSINY